MPVRSYQEALDYLASLIRNTTGERRRGDLKDVGPGHMSTMTALMRALDDPQERFSSVHVGGTSGKGSTVAFIESVLRAAGYMTGMHISPYLQAPTEKATVNGQPVSTGELAEIVAVLEQAVSSGAEGVSPDEVGFVQAWAAAAFLAFARRKADYGVVEVSMGGRYDATNVLHPEVSVVTNVGLDHLSSLGGTLAEIAWHKAGIVKQGRPVATGMDQTDALAVLQEECAGKQAPLYRLGADISYTVREMTATGSRFDAQVMGNRYEGLELGLLGEHQVSNACLALGAIELLRQRGAAISEEAQRRGLREARIPGRLEVVQQDPPVILDGAHNPEKAQSLVSALDLLYSGRLRVLVMGIGAAKDAAEVLRILAPGARLVICTDASVLGKPGLAPDALAAQVRSLGVEARVEPEARRAMELALSLADSASLVCVTGSLFVVGAVRGRWFQAADEATVGEPMSSGSTPGKE